MNRDVLVGIVGAVALVVAMVGVFVYEAGRAGGAAFDVAWSQGDETGPTDSGTTPMGQESEVMVNVTQTNMTGASFLVTWQAQQGSDTVEVTVTPPMGQPMTIEDDSGTINVMFSDINPVPEATTAPGPDNMTALRDLAARFTARNGTGTWTVTVTYVSGTGATPGGLPPVGVDEDVSWSLAVGYEVYRPVLTAR